MALFTSPSQERMASIVSVMSLSSSHPISSAPLLIVSREQPAAKFGDLYFFFTDLSSSSCTLFDGRIMAQAHISPVSSSAANSAFSISCSGAHSEPERPQPWLATACISASPAPLSRNMD